MKLGRGWRRILARRQDVGDELRFHIEERIDELVASGVAREDARREVRKRFGDVHRIAAACRAVDAAMRRDRRRGELMASIWQDLTFAARTLRRHAGFTAVAVLTLALGIGANSAIFSVVNAVLLRPLPFGDPDRLVMVWLDNRVQGFPEDLTSYPNYRDVREGNRSLVDLAAFSRRGFNLTGSGDPQRVRGAAVTGNFFAVLGVASSLGRGLAVSDDEPGASPVVVLSHGLWARRFASDSGILGRTIPLNGEAHEVVGVMAPVFAFPDWAELWVALNPSEGARNARGVLWLSTVGRLRAETSLERARVDLNALMSRIEQETRGSEGNYGITVNTLHGQLVGDVRTALLVLLTAVGLVLLIACANVANLLLARAAGRQGEIALRTALGAGRGRIVRQLLTESVLLAAVGAPLGLLVGFGGLDLLLSLAPRDLPRLDEIGIDGSVLVFTMTVTVASAFVFGLTPAFHATRVDVTAQLREGGRAEVGSRRASLRRALIVAEMALALVLLVGAGLLLRSFDRLQSVEHGFEPDGVVLARLTLPRTRYDTPDRIVDFFRTVTTRLRSVPGVESAGVASSVLIGEFPNSGTFNIEGRPPFRAEEAVEVLIDAIDGGVFPTLGVELKAGRWFTAADDAGQPPVMIINETMARRFWPDADPLGARLTFGNPADTAATWWTIAGVVADVRRADARRAVRPATYLPHAQAPRPNMEIVVRVAGDAGAFTPTIRRVVLAVDPEQPIATMAPMVAMLAERVAQPRFNMWLLGVFAGVAVALAAAGVYGVMAYSVTERTREFGVRMALGARSADVLRLVVGQGMRLALAGIGLGVAGALVLSRLLSTLLFGVSPSDPFTFLAVIGLLTLVALAACFIPARRATVVNSLTAIRGE